MNWRRPGSLFVLTIAVCAGLALQAYLVQTGHQEVIYGYVAGVLVYQTLSDPQWVREITEPDNVVSLMTWILFPFMATLGMVWRLVFVKR